MKLLNLSLLILIFFSFSIFSFGQERFKKAYVIDNNQQKIEGSIDFGTPPRNPEEIIFLDSTTLKISVFKPTDIQSFSVNSIGERRYESRVVQIMDYPKYVEDLDDSGVHDIITKTVFVEVLVKGSASLFYYKDEEKWEHFFSEKDEIFQTLTQTLTLHEMANKNVLVLKQRYKMQLQKVFKDCPAILRRIPSLENTASSLKEIFKDYNECSGNQNAFVKDLNRKKKRYFSFNAGVQVAKLTVTDVKLGDGAEIEALDFPVSIRMPIGVSIDLPLSKKTDKYSLYNELLFTKFRTNGSFVKGNETNIINFRYTYIQYLMAFRYHLKRENSNFSGFVNIGGTMSYGLPSSKAALIKKYTYQQSIIATRNYLLLQTPNLYPLSAVCGFGINYKNYALELRMSYNTGVSYNYDMKSNILAGCLMMTYSPGK